MDKTSMMKKAVILMMTCVGCSLLASGLTYYTGSFFKLDFTNLHAIIRYAFALLIGYLTASVSEYLYEFAKSKFEYAYMMYFRQNMFQGCQRREHSRFQNADIKRMIGQFDQDVDSVYKNEVLSFFDMCYSFTAMIVSLVYIFSVSKFCGLAVVVYGALSQLFPIAFGKKNAALKTDHQDKVKMLFQRAQDVFENKRLVNRATEAHIFGYAAEGINAAENAYFKYGLFRSFWKTIISFADELMITFVFIYSFEMYKRGIMGATEVLLLHSFYEQYVYMNNAFLQSVNNMKSIKNIKAEAIRLTSEKERRFAEETVEKPDLCLKDVYAQYNPEKIYNCSFEFGKKYLLRGANGSGKSTLFDIIHNDISFEGSCKIGNTENTQIDCSKYIFYCDQEQPVFDTDVKKNITLFDTYSPDDSLNRLLMPFIDSDNCAELSSGQKQIILLARALSSDKDIILLDEPFANCSDENRMKLLDLIFDRCKNKTVIIADHHLKKEVVKRFDHIIEL